MALPVILINSATGSDTAASGAGPTTALSGSTGVASGSTITMTANNPDLSGVATDGSAVFWFNDTTASRRNFSKITAVDNTTKVVTVAVAFTAGTQSWAIGGKRATLGGTSSARLINNTSEIAAGWVIEMESGHSETITATLTATVSGDTTNGPIIVRGTSGAATMPILTFSNNGNAFSAATFNYWQFRDFEMRNSNATKTTSVAIKDGSLGTVVQGMKISHSSNNFWRCVSYIGGGSLAVYDCELGYAATDCLFTSSTTPTGPIVVRNNWIHNSTTNGIRCNVSTTVELCAFIFQGNLITSNTEDGINMGALEADASRSAQFIGNTFHGNSGDGIELLGPSTDTNFAHLLIMNNIFTSNGGYGINWSGSGINNAVLSCYGVQIRGNTHYNNTSGFQSASITIDTDTTNVDPSYTNSGGNDYSVSTAVKAKAYPVGGSLYVGRSSTYSYVEPGTAQRQEPASGGSSSRYVSG